MPQFPPQGFIDEYPDLAYLIMADQIASDYLAFIKSQVIPHIDELDFRSVRELRVLMVISISERAIHSRQIAAILRYDPATVSRAVKILLDKGLITEAPDKKDMRATLLSTSEAGQKIADRYVELADKAFANVTPALGAINPREPYMIMTALMKLRQRTNRMDKINFNPDESD